MLSNERHEQIIKILTEKNNATVEDLSRLVFASATTIRRDLNILEKKGLLRRIHGGAIMKEGSTFDAPAFLRRTIELDKKLYIAQLAKQFLSNSSTYFFDSSSSCCALAESLGTDYSITIASNGLNLINCLNKRPSITLVSSGGEVRTNYDELTGTLAIRNIGLLHADVFFFSCAGLSAEAGATEYSGNNVAVKRAFYQNSKKHILLCDSTKIGVNFFFNSFSLDEIDYVITDSKPSQPELVTILGKKLIY